MRNFRDLEIWKNAIGLSRNIYLVAEKFPDTEKYGLISQIKRASVSIASNIAEGSSRSSEKELARYLEIAMGSAFEVEAQLIIAIEVGYIDKNQLNQLFAYLSILQKQINKLITIIRKSNS
jgi:four helix bundle protein